MPTEYLAEFRDVFTDEPVVRVKRYSPSAPETFSPENDHGAPRPVAERTRNRSRPGPWGVIP